jgi:hypothetical protein
VLQRRPVTPPADDARERRTAFVMMAAPRAKRDGIIAAKVPEAGGQPPHDSDSRVQLDAERVVLELLSAELDVELRQKVSLDVDGTPAKPDGVSPDESILVEVFVRIGKLKPAHHEKVARDALKLLALAETRPRARLILAFVDDEAANSIVGWQAAMFKRRKIETVVVDLPGDWRQRILAAQARQKIGMSSAGPA